MLLGRVVEASSRIAQTTKRLVKIQHLSQLLSELAPEEIEIAAAMLTGQARQGRIGVGYAAIERTLTAPAPAATLTLADVDRAFDAIEATEGLASENRRFELLRGLFARATEEEQRFLRNLLAGDLRQGALAGLMLEGVAKASGLPLERVRRAVMVAGSISAVARALMERGAPALEQYDIQLFRPVQPMLAQTAGDVSAALASMGEAAIEFKLDGARVQVHRSGSQVRVFSRRLNEVTDSVPEIVEAVRKYHARDFILDGETIAVAPDGRPCPFQVTMRRYGRILDVAAMRAELPLSPFWFDILYLDGASLLAEPQVRRFAVLTALSPPEAVVPAVVASSVEAAEAFFQKSLDQGHEGVMLKALHSPYVAGARGEAWLKVKRVHTLDLVVTAAEWGHGRRQGWLSNLHLGARDPQTGAFAMLGKTFKGLTDEMLAWQTEELLKLEISRDNYTVFVQPKLVVEIAFNDIQVSPRYPSGLSLRFARVKGYRPDKSADDSDTFETVRKLAGL